MKQRAILYLFLLCSVNVIAQDSIFDALTRNMPGQGKVTIHQPWAVRKLVGAPSASDKIEEEKGTKHFVLPGYRIQVFSGNNQRSSKDEAFGKQGQIIKSYPNIPTYVSYTAPFWRLRVGDFLSYEEAYDMMHKLTTSFPTFKKEIFIIKEDVRIPVH